MDTPIGMFFVVLCGIIFFIAAIGLLVIACSCLVALVGFAATFIISLIRLAFRVLAAPFSDKRSAKTFRSMLKDGFRHSLDVANFISEPCFSSQDYYYLHYINEHQGDVSDYPLF